MSHVFRSLRDSQTGKSLGLILVLTGLFKFLIEYVYFVFLSSDPYFPFNPHPTKYSVGLAVTLSLALLIAVQTRNRPVMRVTMTTFFVFLAIPILSYFAIADQTWIYPTLVVGSLLVTLQFSRLPLVDIAQRSYLTERTTILVVGLILTHTVIFYSVLTYWHGTPPLSPLLYEHTYEIRAAFEPPLPSLKLKGAPVFGYLINWQVKVFNPFLLVYFFKKRRYGLLAAVGFLAVLVYMYVPNTLYVVTPVFVLSVLVLFRFRRVMEGMLALGVVGVFVAYLTLYFWDMITLLYQVEARTLYVVARSEFHFYQWFQQNPHIYFTDSPLNPFWEYPYDTRVTYLYTERYLDSSHNANPGYLADGYGQLGAIGMLGFGVIVGVYLWILDSLAARSDPEIVLGLALMPLFNLTQSDLTSNILTNGMFLAVVISAIYVKNQKDWTGFENRISKSTDRR